MKLERVKRFMALAMSLTMIFTSSAVNVFAADTTEVIVEDTAIETTALDYADDVIIESSEDVSYLGSSDATLGDGETYNIEINQGFSKYENKDQKESESYNYQNDFVASKATVIAIEVAGSTEDEVKNKIANWELTYNEVVNGEEKSEAALTWKGNEFEIKSFYDQYSNEVTSSKMAVVRMTTGPSKGTYTFHLKDGDKEIAKNEKVNFFETQTLNILAVPVISYYSKAQEGDKKNQAHEVKAYDTSSFNEWNGIDATLKTYLKKVYPVADINIELGQSLDLSDPKYDLADGEGPSQKLFWEECNKLQVKDKDTGKDKYDLILAFVPYRQDAGGTGQGYTFGKPTNIITLMDDDMLPTVAHEIAHCYKVGDEYDGGSYNARVNDMPLGYGKGRDKESGDEIEGNAHLQAQNVDITEAEYHWRTSDQFKTFAGSNNVAGGAASNVEGGGNGSVIDPQLHSYDLENEKFISFAKDGEKVYPTISYMGSGYSGSDGYYYTTSVIWNHLFKELMVKEKSNDNSEEQSGESEEQSNAQIFMNSGEASILAAEEEGFNLEDFYYDDNYREGSSKMVEVSGTIFYDAATQKANISSVSMNALFSYDGDLSYMEYMDADEEKSHHAEDLFYFMALDKDGKVITSPVDGKKAVFEFYAGNFNPNMPAPERGDSTQADKRYQKFAAFNFDAEYPDDTEKFAVVRKPDYKEDGVYTTNVLWSIDTPKQELEGDVLYADVDSDSVQVDFAVTAYDEEGVLDPENAEDLAKIRSFYSKVYYAPYGDDGQTYFVKDGTLAEFYDANTDCYTVKFDPRKFGKNNADAYVWVMVSDGVNGADMFSDDVDVSVTNAKIAISGGKKGTNKNGFPGLKVFNYTGSEVKPKVKVKVKDLEKGKTLSLVEGRDYVLSYTDNVNAGVGTIKIKGIGEYSGTNSVFFGIKEGTVKKAKIAALPDLVYSASMNKVGKKEKNVTQSELESYLDVMVGKKELTVDKDYYPTYVIKTGKKWPNKSNAKKSISVNFVEGQDSVDVRVYVNGKGNFTGTSKLYGTFTLYRPGYEFKDIAKEVKEVVLKSNDVTYTGNRVNVKVNKVVLNDGSTLPKKNYKVLYLNNKNIGKATIKIVGKKGYVGTYKTTFDVKKATVNKLTVSKIPNIYYTGRAISENDINVTVKAGKYILKRGVDYTVSLNGILDTPTIKEMKNAKNAPKVVISLIENDTVNGKTVKHELPVEVTNKTAEKTFTILKGRFGSNALTSVVLDSISANEVQGLFSRNSEKKLFKNYAYIIETGADIEANDDAASILKMKVKVAGKVLNKDEYTVKITRTRVGKVGSITIIPKDTTKYTGRRVIKFKNVRPQ